jgi:hypothetical protein
MVCIKNIKQHFQEYIKIYALNIDRNIRSEGPLINLSTLSFSKWHMRLKKLVYYRFLH